MEDRKEEMPTAFTNTPAPGASSPPQATRKEEGFGSFLADTFEVLILTVILFLAIRSVVQNFRIEGHSMEPNFHDGQYLIVNRWAYCPGIYVDIPKVNIRVDLHRCLWQPKRGDVIVFRYPRNPRRDYIKRVIGLPGETMEIRRGVVYINGKPLAEPYRLNHATYNTGPITLGPDEIYVLGDNRPNSSDSHAWGPLKEKYIIGKAIVSYFPPKYWGIVSHYHVEPGG